MLYPAAPTELLFLSQFCCCKQLLLLVPDQELCRIKRASRRLHGSLLKQAMPPPDVFAFSLPKVWCPYQFSDFCAGFVTADWLLYPGTCRCVDPQAPRPFGHLPRFNPIEVWHSFGHAKNRTSDPFSGSVSMSFIIYQVLWTQPCSTWVSTVCVW